MLFVFLSLLNTFSALFIMSNSPISMVIMIILSCLMICLISLMMFSCSWYSYVLFLIFLGGLMVLFVYICSVASNEISNKGSKMKNFILSLIVLLSAMCFIKLDPYNFVDMNLVSAVSKMFISMSYSFITATMVYLLLTLFVSVLISKMKFGPIRTKKL